MMEELRIPHENRAKFIAAMRKVAEQNPENYYISPN